MSIGVITLENHLAMSNKLKSVLQFYNWESFAFVHRDLHVLPKCSL